MVLVFLIRLSTYIHDTYTLTTSYIGKRCFVGTGSWWRLDWVWNMISSFVTTENDKAGMSLRGVIVVNDRVDDDDWLGSLRREGGGTWTWRSRRVGCGQWVAEG